MRIIGGHDYYDSAAQFGVDTTVCFVRNKITDPISSKKFPLDFKTPSFYVKGKKDRNYHIGNQFWYPKVVVIGDTIWGGLTYNGPSLDKKENLSSMNITFWKYDALEAFLDKYDLEFHLRHWLSKDEEHFSPEYFGPKEISKPLMDWMLANGIAVLTGKYSNRDNCFEVNVNNDDLKDFEFFRIIDAFQTHQKIEQWVTGVLPHAGNPMIEIVDDKIKAEKHGFFKWSFRKPGKKGM